MLSASLCTNRNALGLNNGVLQQSRSLLKNTSYTHTYPGYNNTTARHQSSTPDVRKREPVASTSAIGEGSSSSSDSKIAGTGSQRPQLGGWDLRKRLRRLTIDLGAVPSEGDVQSAPASKWKHPSRPKRDVESMRKDAEHRWTEQAGQAAKESAVANSREKLRQESSLTRAERNVKSMKAAKAERRRLAQSQNNAQGGSVQQSVGQGERKATMQAEEQLPYEGNSEESVQEETKISVPASRAKRSHQIQFSPGVDSDTVRGNWQEVLEKLNGGVKDAPPHLVMNAREDEGEEEGASQPSSSKSTSSYKKSRSEKGNNDWSTDVPPSELISGASISTFRRVKAAKDISQLKQSSRLHYLPMEWLSGLTDKQKSWWDKDGKWHSTVGGLLNAEEVKVTPVEPLREMEVPALAHGLDRVLFNPGVHWLRDVRSGIYNFEPELRNIQDVDLFDYSALPPYLTSSKDPELAELVHKMGKKYSGSTSSMTGLLSHIYFLISAWKQPDLSNYSSGFDILPKNFSYGAKLPASIILRRFEEEVDGEMRVRYAIDADKGDSGEDNNYVLMQLGKSVEKLLTSSPEVYNKYMRINSHVLSEEEKTKKEAYHYSMTDKFVMRSQLDCYDERLPRKTFDLKTRSVIAVRQDRANWVESSGYMIRHNTGVMESFEREMWDMTRAALLKYYFQAKIGGMDGILVAYHSTATMYGFQYLPCEDLAVRLFSSVEMGEQAFRLSVGLLERILDTITELKPNDVSEQME
jgi:hypothetical protein